MTLREPKARLPRIIACLDVRAGRVVKGVRFGDLRDVGDPVELAVAYAADGADEIVFLDIDATIVGRKPALDQVAAMRQAIDVPLTVGGGIRSLIDAQALFDAGADKVTVNSAAVSRPQLISDIAACYGSQAVVVAIDAWRVAVGDAAAYQVRVRGGTVPLRYDAPAWGAMAIELGASELLVTSWDRDGSGAGYDLDLLAAMRSAVDAPIIASGGARDPGDLAAALAAGADAVLVASMVHDGRYGIGTIKSLLTRRYDVPTRITEALC